MKQVIKKKIVEKHNIDVTKYEYTLVCDGSSILKNSLVANKLNSKGLNYAPIIQFFLTIKQVLAKRDFSKCYVFFDDNLSGQLRANIYPLYKSNRDKHYELSNLSDYDKKINDYVKKVLEYSRNKKKEQEVKRGETDEETYARCMNVILQMCEELFIRTYMAEYVEGDDLIAYVAHNRKPNEKVVIISGDRDISQLVNEDVTLYVLQTKKYITVENSVEQLGYRCDNIVLQKIFCGDQSDAIKGIKGIAEKGFTTLFPDVLTRKVSVDEVISMAKEINEQRAKEKKKPLKSCENIVNCVTDGIQGDKLFEINEKIISLDKPLLTEEAEKFMKDFISSPIDAEDRTMENLYKIICENGMEDLYDGEKFSNFFQTFSLLIHNEKNYKT